MPRRTSLAVLIACLTLSGCAASIAAGALGAAARSARGDPNAYYNDEALKLAAAQACRDRAGSYGEVHIIEIEQRGASKIVIWGTATGTAGRQSFDCTYTNRITRFRLRSLDR